MGIPTKQQQHQQVSHPGHDTHASRFPPDNKFVYDILAGRPARSLPPTRSTGKEPGARLLHRHRCPASRICRRCLRRVGPPRPEAAAPGDASRAAGSQTDVRACATRTCQPTAPVRPAIGRRGAHAGAMPSSTKLPCATDRPTGLRVKGGAAIDTPPTLLSLLLNSSTQGHGPGTRRVEGWMFATYWNGRP